MNWKHRAGALLLALAMALSLTLPAAAEDSGEDALPILNYSQKTIEVGGAPLELVLSRGSDTSYPTNEETVVWSADKSGVVSLETQTSAAAMGRQHPTTCKVTALQPGEVTVTASYPEGEIDCHITVEEASLKPTGIEFNRTSPQYIERGSTLSLVAYVTPSNAEGKVSWTSSDSSVVSAAADETDDRRCVLEGKAAGTATITARIGDQEKQCVVEVSGIRINKTSLELYEGGKETVTALCYGAARNVPVIWESQSEPVVSVANGNIYANSVGTAEVIVTAGTNYRAVCTVTVKENVAGVIERSVSGGMSYALSGVIGDLQSRCTEMTKDSLKLVRSLTVAPSQGILHYNYTSPEFQGEGVGSEPYYLSPGSSLERGLSNVTFVPAGGFTGNADINYTGESAEGKNFSGIIRIKVTSTGDVTYSTASNLPVTFEAADFTAVCRPRTGQEIKYVSFQQPTGGRGTLYQTYSATAQYNAPVVSSDKFYRTSSPELDEVTYVPGENFSGTVRIPYLCVTTSNGSYTGTVTVHVYAASTAEGQGHVNYTVAPGSRVTLNASDFNSACRDATGNTLDYVYFDLPSSSQGTLYLNYRSASNPGSRISATTRYYRSSTPQISNITFVPASGFTGTVTVPFTAFDRYGERFQGNLVIRVTGSDGTVSYTTGAGRPVTFEGLDFNEACQRANGASLDYISFELPASSRGTLYRDYRSSSSTGRSLGSSTRLYYRGSPSISDVTFVPRSGFTGTVSIPFSGYDSSGGRFSGTVEITVGAGSDSEVVSYTTTSGGVVGFNASDFNSACQAITGERLDYLRFSLPASRYGTLYYQYDSGRGSGSSVSSSASYYRSGGSRLLDDVSFLAASGASGTVSFEYTGYNTAGQRFTGTVEIRISAPQRQVIRYSTTSAPVSMAAADFRSACSAALGGTLSYIRFGSLPGSAAGQMRLGYSSSANPGTYANTGVSYYADSTPSISQLSFIPGAGYQGVASISYTGYDTQGRSFNGTVEITVNNASVPSSAFTDLGGYSGEFVTAINYLNRAGVVNGYGGGQFGPGRQVSRGEFALMVCRAFNLNTDAASSFPDVPAGSVYAWAVATARDLGVVQGSGGKGSGGMYYPNSPITRQAAMTMICRAMRAAGRTVPNVSVSVLAAYSDNAQLSDYARASVASLVEMGAVRGDAAMRLNPTQSITRAQMAVILYRVLTTG